MLFAAMLLVLAACGGNSSKAVTKKAKDKSTSNVSSGENLSAKLYWLSWERPIWRRRMKPERSRKKYNESQNCRYCTQQRLYAKRM
ncbi:hypothetical protein ACEQPO_26130 [Bacillus sp. SL00103]